jgi:nucleoid DNA-binding protein
MTIPTSIDKRILWKYVNAKINNSIHNRHVYSVICILFDEILNDLTKGKKIEVINFGTIFFKILKARRYHDVCLRKVTLSEGGKKILKIALDTKFKKKLCSCLDVDKTFGNANV